METIANIKFAQDGRRIAVYESSRPGFNRIDKFS